MSQRVRVLLARVVLALVVLALMAMASPASPAAPGSRELELTGDYAAAAGRTSWQAAELAGRHGPYRLTAGWRPGAIARLYATGPGRGPVESWASGRLHLRFGTGVSGAGAAPNRRFGFAAGSGRGFIGGAVLVRAPPGRVLVACGAEDGVPAQVIAMERSPAAILLATARGARPRLSVLAQHGRADDRWVLEVVCAPRPALALEVAAGVPPGVTELQLRLPVSESVDGVRPLLGLELRSARGAARAALGVRTEPGAAGSAGDREGRGHRARAWADASAPVGGAMRLRMRGEWRAEDDRAQARLRGEWESALARAAIDWCRGGGIVLQLRSVWSLAKPLAVEAGGASWSGPVAASGATIDLPAVPAYALTPSLAAAGSAAGILIDWQQSRFRVRLGWTFRQRRHAAPESRFASRVELVWKREQTGS
jgi:hypothetical protein